MYSSTQFARDLNFLHEHLPASEGVRREGNVFIVSEPWAQIRFENVPLKSGWWRLHVEGGEEMPGLEVRLVSRRDPLVSLRLPAARSARIQLRSEQYSIVIVCSAWPGRAAFSKFGLERLSLPEEAALVGAAGVRLLQSRNPADVLSHVFGRFAAGQPVGMNISGSAAKAVRPHRISGAAVQPPSSRIEFDGFSAFICEGDKLHPDTQAIVARAFDERQDLVAVFSDAEEEGGIIPHPAWDKVLAEHFDYADAPLFVRANFATAIAGATIGLPAIAARHGDNSIGRIALPLVQRMARLKLDIREITPPGLAIRPSVSIVIPTKIRIDLLERCLQGLAERTSWPDLDVTIVDNGASDPNFPLLVERMSKHLRLAKVEDFGSFNFSRLINLGVRNSKGEFVLLMNDDVEPFEPDWLSRMMDSAVKEDTGAVGAQLLFPDGAIQHAGVSMGIGGVAGHLWQGLSAAEASTNPYIMYPGSRMAVTGACLLVRRSIYEDVNGFDEAFPVALNDIDFCLRLHKKGYRNIYRGDAKLVHHESQSRGHDDTTIAKRRRLAGETQVFLDRWQSALTDDAFTSPAVDPLTLTGAVNPAAFSLKGYVSPN